ncbi:HAD family phosphatase [Clostridium sp. SYSU_GA19001]|uniref:HAD family hydrolase n=1 Tax=Clostridium caldaquaticum TaxID=2940653 RepID=UPI002076EACD|nr:HAD family phosphatase [Clostridium caldaquaticum]MCM8711406.1 HAD family phosphatase [Clostridium caldaquaticum]
MFKAAIFDMDGVIIDSEPIYYKICSEFLNGLNVNMTKDEYYTYVGKPAEEMWKSLKKKYNLKESIEELVKINRENYINYLKTSTEEKLIDGVMELMKSLYENNIKLALASSTSLKNIYTVLDKFNLTKFFQVIVSGDDIKEGKTSPQIFLYTAEKLKAAPCECIVIEDSCLGINSAKKAGMKCIAIDNVNSGKQDRSSADLIIKSFSDIDYFKLCSICK